MPDLASRRTHEATIAAALAVLFDDYRADPSTFNPATFEQRLQAALSGKLAVVYSEAGSEFASGFGAAVSPDVVSANAARWEAQFLPVLAGVIAKTTDPLAPGSFALSRAEMIAATEVTRAISAVEMAVVGYLATADDDGVTKSRQPIWYTALDERVCPVCEPLHGTGEEVWGMVAPDGPPAHPNCRCYWTFSD